jgi:hypothetical protein
MSPDQIVGAAMALLGGFVLLVCYPKFAESVRDSFWVIFTGHHYGYREIKREIAAEHREKAFEAEADRLRQAAWESTGDVITRIERELNRVEWERQTVQGERAPVLNQPPTERLEFVGIQVRDHYEPLMRRVPASWRQTDEGWIRG